MTTTAPNLPQGPTSLGTDDPALCRKCGGKMLRGHALQNTLTGRVTISRTGRAEIVPCLKCIQCGYSVTVDP